MKVGDLVASRACNEEAGDHLACSCPQGLEVLEDRGETARLRCVGSDNRCTVSKKHLYVVKTLEERLEENDLNPVMGR